jgi:MATE family multidrug resistance protein
LVLIEKPKINFYISAISLVIQIITGYLLVVVFRCGVRGSALSYLFASIFNSISSTMILKRMNLEEGSLVFFTKEGLNNWKNYLDVAIPGVLISGGEWIGYELQSIFVIYISPLDYSTQIIVINLELLTFPFTGAINSAISMKSGEKLMTMKPEKLKNYFLMSYLFSFLTIIIVLLIVIFFGDYFFYIMSPKEEIYLNCCKIKYMVCWYIFAENVYYFYLGCLKGYGYLRNTTIVTMIMFFVISPLLIYILSFRNNYGVKGIWESTSIAMTLGDILFIYWVFSFDIVKIKELANKRIKADNKNIIQNEKEIKEIFLKNIDNSDDNANENN